MSTAVPRATETYRVLLLDGGHTSPAGSIQASGFEIEPCSGVEHCLERLDALADAGRPADAILIGPHQPQPLGAAYHIRGRDRLVPLVFLVPPGQADRFRQTLAFSPSLGDALTQESPPDSLPLGPPVREAAQTGRRRRQIRLAFDHINRHLRSRDPAASLEQQRLAVSDRYLASLLEHAPDAILSTNPAGQIVSWNEAARRMFGHASDEAIGRPLSLLFPSERLEAVLTLLEEVHSGAAVSRREMVCRRRDGSLFDAEITLALVHDSLDTPIGIAAIARDVTERKRLADALRQRADELAEADRRKDEFLAMLAHELRNPLAPILNAVEVLRLQGSADGSVGWALEAIERQGRNMARLIDDLLDVSRITRGQIRLRPQRVELGELMRRAAETVQPAVEARRHRLDVEGPEQPVWIEADPVRVEQVLVNLLDNAAKYTEPGGHLWLQGGTHDGDAILRVRDTGMGIPPEVLPHVFELFTQGPRTLDRSQGGLGIGLTLVHRLVTMHGGTVSAHSAGPGQGAEFCVRLPLAGEAAGD